MKNENVSDKIKTLLKIVHNFNIEKPIDISKYDLIICMLFIQKVSNLSQNSCLKRYDDFKVDISVLDVTIKYVHTIDDMDKILDTIIKEKQIKTISDIIPLLDVSEEYINQINGFIFYNIKTFDELKANYKLS
jgi:hypothetical protein